MITINNFSYSFGTQILYDNMSLTINPDQRIGLVGRNGTGKSTLLKLIMEATKEPNPHISVSNNIKIGHLPQDVVVESKKAIIEEAVEANKELAECKAEIERLEAAIMQHDTPELQTELVTAQHEYHELNPDAIYAKAKSILMGLGFKETQFEQPVTSLSVGWRMRILLAKLLLQDADFYLFDEPTNHLDIVAKDWFLRFLKDASFGFIMVSHERYFLNQLTDYTLELELGKGKLYYGNYDAYEVEKAAATQRLETAYREQQKEIKRKQATIDRFRSKSSKAKMAQSMMKQLDKMERIELPPSPKNISFSFAPPERSGRTALQVDEVGYSFGPKKIFDHATFTIERGQKVAVVAPNGVGKTTLFNLIVGKYPLQKGSLELGHNVHPMIFEQDQAASLQQNRTILENIENVHPKKSEQEIRKFLGCFLFTGDDIQKKVKVLSGGEKNKVGMANVLLSDANLLLLDEPTNHLDMPSKEVLLKALNAYQGTIVFVSHDHDFINKLATHIIELSANGTKKYVGNYDDYLAQKNPNTAEPARLEKTTPKHEKKAQKETYSNRKEIRALEKKVERLEQKIHATELKFADHEYGTPEFTRLQKKLTELKDEHAATYQAWEALL